MTAPLALIILALAVYAITWALAVDDTAHDDEQRSNR